MNTNSIEEKMIPVVESNKYRSIEFLRFLAASAVVFVHIPVVGFGHFGVDVFFAISGFVMLLSTSKSSSHFFLKRLIRVVPAYYLFTAFVFLIALTLPAVLNNTSADFSHLLKSLFLYLLIKMALGTFQFYFWAGHLTMRCFFT